MPSSTFLTAPDNTTLSGPVQLKHNKLLLAEILLSLCHTQLVRRTARMGLVSNPVALSQGTESVSHATLFYFRA